MARSAFEGLEWAEGELYELICRSFDYEGEPSCVQDDGLPRIYLRRDKSLWVVVDQIDFEHFSKWRWSWSATPRGKLYAQRSVGGGGKKVGGFTMTRPSHSLYLHREIQKRKGTKMPSPEHKFVDHRNGNSLDCRRDNLRWATVSMNNTNLPGSEERERQLEYLARAQAAR